MNTFDILEVEEDKANVPIYPNIQKSIIHLLLAMGYNIIEYQGLSKLSADNIAWETWDNIGVLILPDRGDPKIGSTIHLFRSITTAGYKIYATEDFNEMVRC